MIRLALAQLDVTVGALADNRRRLEEACADAARLGADLVLAPEHALAGYPPEDLVLRPSFLAACRREAEALAAAIEVPLLAGLPWLDGDRVRNSVVVCAGGGLVARYDKRELPNYGVFDEERTFSAGRRGLAIRLGTALCGVTICEDIWLPDGPGLELVLGGATVLLNVSASPFALGKGTSREEMLRTRARDGLCFVAFCNLVGGQDELVFDGRSLVVGPEGEILARARAFAEDLVLCDIEPGRAVSERLRDSRLRRGRRRRRRMEPAAELPAGEGDRVPLEPHLAAWPETVEDELWAALVLGLRDYVDKNGFDAVLIGLSGGVDSALVTALAVDALGPDRVQAVSMPTRYNREETRSDARLVAERLGVGFREIPIEDLRVTVERLLPGLDGLAAENVQSRLRAVILMALSNQVGWLVLTTGNKSETATGYSTLYGDTAGGFAPIKDLPKTVVYALARRVNEVAGHERIPSSILERAPSAELRQDQRDDDALPAYAALDPVLEAYVEDDLSPAEIAALGIGDAELAGMVARLVDRAEYKRRQNPPGLKLRAKAFGRDRRLPITNQFRPG
jgi:NAD+ synthase (glutamine-hydrolysing)